MGIAAHSSAPCVRDDQKLSRAGDHTFSGSESQNPSGQRLVGGLEHVKGSTPIAAINAPESIINAAPTARGVASGSPSMNG